MIKKIVPEGNSLSALHTLILDSSDFILLTSHALKNWLTETEMREIQENYLHNRHDAAIQQIVNLHGNHRDLQGSIVQFVIQNALSRLKDHPCKNESRRFFETRLAEILLQQTGKADYESLNLLRELISEVSPDLPLPVTVDSHESAEAVLNCLRNLGEPGGVFAAAIKTIRNQSALSCSKDRGRYKVENEKTYSDNAGIILSSSPEFLFNRKKTQSDRVADKFRMNTIKPGYSAARPRVPYVNSVSGTTYTFAYVMEKFMKRYADNPDVRNHALNLARFFVASMCYGGFHSFSEMLDVLKEQQQCIPEFSNDEINKAFDRATEYALRLCQKRQLHYELMFRSRTFSKDELWLHKNKAQVIEHDALFNDRKKARYESKLSVLIFRHKEKFMSVLDKVSCLILPDIIRVSDEMMDKTEMWSSVSAALHRHFMQFEDFNLFWGSATLKNTAYFYSKLIQVLTSTDPEDFYMKLCIHRAYIIFFTEKGLPKPVLEQAVHDQWSSSVDLQQLVSTTRAFRERLFQKNLRLSRPHMPDSKKISTRVGIMAYDDTLEESVEIPPHRKGMLQYLITTKGDFTASGVHEHDIPQLCGPSGMIAMRLALAEQAGLSADEKSLYHFAVALYTVAIGGHSIDECFMIGAGSEYSAYKRGDYTTIVPERIKKDGFFAALWQDIQGLDRNLQDLKTVSMKNPLRLLSFGHDADSKQSPSPQSEMPQRSLYKTALCV